MTHGELATRIDSRPAGTREPLLLALAGSETLGRAVAEAAGAEFAVADEREFERGEHKARCPVSVRGRDVAVLHRVHGEVEGTSVNDRLLRLWFLTASVRDAGARSVTVCAPYLPYARKDRRTRARDPLGSRYVAQHFEASGANRIVVIEPHDLAAFENAFRIEAIALPLAPLLLDWLATRAPAGPFAIVSPDVGGTKRAQRLRELLGRRLGLEFGFAFVEKRRASGVLSGELLVGNVDGATCLLLDDLISSGTTLARAAAACRKGGARAAWVAAAHPLFLPEAAGTLSGTAVERILVTDSVPVAAEVAAQLPLETLPLGPYLGATLDRIWRGGSVSELAGLPD